MRELGTRAGAPVEPDEMGRVLRASTDGANGVLGGGVPGGEFIRVPLRYVCMRTVAKPVHRDGTS